jgi:hypothetical protein
MPGVVVTTATKSGPSASLRAPSSQVFMVGQAERGDTTKAIILNGMADVSTYLGDRPTYGSLYDQLKVYFDEGGTRAIVARVVGPAAAVGLLVLNDQNGVAAPTLRVEAQNAGAWSSRLKAQVLAGFAPNTFRIIITLDDQIVEDKTNMSTPTDAVNRFAQSPYVKVVNLASATAAPANNPAVVAATSLSAATWRLAVPVPTSRRVRGVHPVAKSPRRTPCWTWWMSSAPTARTRWTGPRSTSSARSQGRSACTAGARCRTMSATTPT